MLHTAKSDKQIEDDEPSAQQVLTKINEIVDTANSVFKYIRTILFTLESSIKYSESKNKNDQ